MGRSDLPRRRMGRSRKKGRIRLFRSDPDHFDMNYNDLDQSIAEFIGQTFRETADNIMHTSPSERNFSLMRIVTIFLMICVVVIFIGILVLKRTNRKEDDL